MKINLRIALVIVAISIFSISLVMWASFTYISGILQNVIGQNQLSVAQSVMNEIDHTIYLPLPTS